MLSPFTTSNPVLLDVFQRGTKSKSKQHEPAEADDWELTTATCL
jgi:hypothetical protein